jgi:hypothetical protein
MVHVFISVERSELQQKKCYSTQEEAPPPSQHALTISFLFLSAFKSLIEQHPQPAGI